MRYIKKPVEIEAFQIGIEHVPEWFYDAVSENKAVLHGWAHGFYYTPNTDADIKTLEGWVHADCGDFIIRGVKGEIYPCKPDIFAMTYEPVKE